MILTIDNFDGEGARDYTGALDAEHPPRVRRRLNAPSEMRAWLYACGADFVVPACGARVSLARNNGSTIFTGYSVAPPEHEYLGWSERGPVYRYELRAESDETLLAGRTLPKRADFVQRAAGDVLKTLAEDLAPGAFDAAACDGIAVLPDYFPDARKRFHEHAAELGLRARGSYRVQDGRLSFRSIGAVFHAISESSPNYVADALKLTPIPSLRNDVTLSGEVGPAQFVKDYFYGDGATLGFYLSETPFLRPGVVLLEDEYRGTTLRPEYWSVLDPNGAIALSQGKLRVTGGGLLLGTTMLRAAEKIELGGALALDHGEFEFASACEGLAGAVYTGGFGLDACLAGFQFTPDGASTRVGALVNAVAAGQSLTTTPGRRYALSTRIYASEPYRVTQPFASPGITVGGDTIASGARILMLVHEIDPNDPASLVTPAVVLYEGWLPDVPAYCDYVLINAVAMSATVSYTRLARLSGAEVRTCALFGSWRDRLEGAMADGGECRVSGSELRFYPASAPGATERIVVSYRAAARTIARVTDPDSIAPTTNVADDGRRSLVSAMASPPARTFEDCENAARTLLETTAGAGYTGEYTCWSDMLDDDIHPGDALAIDVPSRAHAFTAIVREVEVEAADPLYDRSRYRVRFATESAEPIGVRVESAPRLQLPDAVAVAELSTGFAPSAASTEIVDIGSTEVMIDAGAEPLPGGGFEVRRSDSGWGMENDRTLINRFNYRIFSVPRLSRSQTWYVRPYDATGKYSRVSTVLHVDCSL